MSWSGTQTDLRFRTLAPLPVEILYCQPSTRAATEERTVLELHTSSSPFPAPPGPSPAQQEGAECPPSSEYLWNHQFALGWLLSFFFLLYPGGGLSLLTGVKCGLCLETKNRVAPPGQLSLSGLPLRRPTRRAFWSYPESGCRPGVAAL